MSALELPVCVKLKKNGDTIIRADSPDQIIHLEGNWYFHPSLVDRHIFNATDRLYTCPYKGTCNWVDYDKPGLYLPDVAWVYPETLPDYMHIAGWYGFYPSTVYYETGAC